MKVDLWDHGPLTRADGHRAYNGYFWSQNPEDHHALGGRYGGGDWMLWVVPLSDGRWLAKPPGSYLRGPYFASRADALRTAVARILKRLRYRRRPAAQPWSPRAIGDAEFGRVTAWLFEILVRNFGARRRWRWRRACGRSLAASAKAGWDLDMARRWIEHEARQRVGEWPRTGKRLQREYETRLGIEIDRITELRADTLRTSLLRASATLLRQERLAAAKPWQ